MWYMQFQYFLALSDLDILYKEWNIKILNLSKENYSLRTPKKDSPPNGQAFCSYKNNFQFDKKANQIVTFQKSEKHPIFRN